MWQTSCTNQPNLNSSNMFIFLFIPIASTLNRRASIGVTRLAKPAQSTANRLNSSSVLSRSATATPVNGTNAQSKVALVRKTASIGTRLSNIAASAKTTLLSATPTTQAASLKRPSLISRRSTGKVTNGNTPSTSTASTSAAASSTNSVRKTGTTSKLAPPPKNVNKWTKTLGNAYDCSINF